MEKVKIGFRDIVDANEKSATSTREGGGRGTISSVNARSLLIRRYYFAEKFAREEKGDEGASIKATRSTYLYASSSHGRIREDSLPRFSRVIGLPFCRRKKRRECGKETELSRTYIYIYIYYFSEDSLSARRYKLSLTKLPSRSQDFYINREVCWEKTK